LRYVGGGGVFVGFNRQYVRSGHYGEVWEFFWYAKRPRLSLRGRFLLGGCSALCLHLAAVEAHVADFAAAVRRESSGQVIQ